MEPPVLVEKPSPEDEDRDVQTERELGRRLRRLTRRGFVWVGVTALAGLAGWRWLVTRGDKDGLPWPLGRVLRLDERVARRLFAASRLSPEFLRSAARMPRFNGGLGLTVHLKLVIPTKYGIKNIKQIGTIRFTDERPADYWAERGYDWYAGH